MQPRLSVVVRAVVAADEPQWRDLWRAYLAFYETELPDDTYRETFRRLIAGDAGMFGLLALSGGTALGLAHYLAHSNFWNTAPTCYLQDLFTTPAARGQGVARALMQAVFAASDAADLCGVYWLTAETNHAGRMLYDQVGVKTPFIVYERAA